jgi:histidyl-tRNA synthetase
LNFSLPRGLRDLNPTDYEGLEKIRVEFIEVCQLFGFQLMEPSPIELINTLEAKSGPTIRDEVYHFKDKGGRDIGLRFDLTVGLTRFVASNRGFPLPVKIGSFAGMWRYDEPQHGRYRWFYQWDVEIFGTTKIDADVEIIDFTSTLFRRLGLKNISIEISDRSIIDEFIHEKLEIYEKSIAGYLLRALDKLERKSMDEVLQEYSNKGVKKEVLERLINFGNIKGEPEQVLSILNDEKFNKSSDISVLVDSLKERNVPNVSLNMGIVRGLDYYSGIVFEVFENGKRNLGALAGGGRYNYLPEIFGRKNLGATGVAGGVERTILAINNKDHRRIIKKQVFLGFTSIDFAGIASRIAKDLRDVGIPVELEISRRTLKKQLEHASKSSSIFVIVGPRDYAEKKVTIRDLRSGEESIIEISDLQSEIESRL